MSFTTLVSAEQLRDAIAARTPLVVLDCSFDLMNPAAGEEQYRQAHIPGAVYANLDTALSDQGVVEADATHHPHSDAASGGRHPLPSREKFALWLSSVGFANDMQAVVYDRQGNNYCGRLWWMLKWAGHEAVAMLDGGWAAWQAAGGEVETREPTLSPQAPYPLREPQVATIDADTLAKGLGRVRLVDARAAERFRGEVEPIDAQAGHIPGASNRFHKNNLASDGRFKPRDELRAEFEDLVAGLAPDQVVHQCGSGVTACHNLLAMEAAGLTGSVLYPGSWSEWSSDPARPIAKG
jgi:thiosulfate/3-mercaptopyruvate sulfurtransferase